MLDTWTPLRWIGDRAAMTRAVVSGLRAHGLLLIEGLTHREALLELADAVGAVVSHRDSDQQGVTRIADLSKPVSVGYEGFTDRALSPHTDRSSVADPPGLLLMACQQPATVGGECVFVDGKAVYDDLAQSDPEAVAAFSTPRSVLFGGAAGYLGSIFTHEQGRVLCRLRTDRLARFSPAVARWLPVLRSTIDRHTHALLLDSGQGYIVDNHRWLHGRRAFSGPRVMFRVHADPSPHLNLTSGFRTGSSACGATPSSVGTPSAWSA